MTVPIMPGPWSFLADAGQAAGAVGTSIEERKRHGEEIAFRSAQSIIQQLVNGADPTILDDPAVQSVFQKGLGFKVNSQLYAAVGGAERFKGMTGAAEVKAGVPAAQAAADLATAQAAKPQAELAGATAQAQLTDNIPQLSADAQAAQALATKSGAQLNTSIYEGARSLLGTDPKFAKLSYEAATGALDAKFRYLEYARAGMTIERQRMVDEYSALRTISLELGKSYDADVASWRKELNDATVLITNPKKKQDAQANWIAANPPPDRETSYAKAIKSYGMTMDEFQTAYRNSMSQLFGPGGVGENAPTTPPPGQPQSPSLDLTSVVNKAQALKPEDAADAVADLIRNDQIGPIQLKVVLRSLKLTSPGDWWRKFNRKFALSQTETAADTTVVAQ